MEPKYVEIMPEGSAPPVLPEDSPTQKGMLHALQGRAVYTGTVPPKVIAKRRAANKRAKASRRGNR